MANVTCSMRMSPKDAGALYLALEELRERHRKVVKELETAHLDTVTTFGAELVNNYERNFMQGEDEIMRLCQTVLDMVKQEVEL